jgi:hypothetical protein
MSERPLYAPWRMDYIRSLDKPDAGKCFLCEAAAAQTEQEKADRLVLWTTPQTVVLINRYPYTNGHLLIAPREHIADLELLADDVATDLHRQTARAIKLLKLAQSPQGFNTTSGSTSAAAPARGCRGTCTSTSCRAGRGTRTSCRWWATSAWSRRR